MGNVKSSWGGRKHACRKSRVWKLKQKNHGVSRKLILGKSKVKLCKSSQSSILLYPLGARSAVSFFWFLHSWERSDPVKGLVSFILKVELINKWGGNKQRLKSVLVSAFSVWEVSHPSAGVQVLKEAEYQELAQLRDWNWCGAQPGNSVRHLLGAVWQWAKFLCFQQQSYHRRVLLLSWLLPPVPLLWQRLIQQTLQLCCEWWGEKPSEQGGSGMLWNEKLMPVIKITVTTDCYLWT